MTRWLHAVGAASGAVSVVAASVLALAPPAAAAPGPAAAPEYWFDTWHLPSLYAQGVQGQGITIAEIDTGVNAALPELRGRVLRGTDLGVPGGDGRTDRAEDGFGHGTAMASIMVARSGLLGITGMAPAAKILPIAVALRGTTDADRPDDLPEAIRYAADHGAKIISMSLGGERTPSSDREPCPDDEQAAVYHALRKGSIVVAAVGNTGPTRNVVEDPGVCLGVVAVGSVDRSGTVASFSTRQPYVTLVAPGVNIPSLGRFADSAYSGKGTSQSTAIVSATLALVWSRYPTLTGSQVVARVLATLDDRRTSPSSSYGYGSMNAYRAVTANVPRSAPNPVSAAVAPFLAREAALAQEGLGPAPRPAARAGTPGTYAVASRSRVNDELLAGLALAAAGVILLVTLLAGRLLWRPARRRIESIPAVTYAGPGPPD